MCLGNFLRFALNFILIISTGLLWAVFYYEHSSKRTIFLDLNQYDVRIKSFGVYMNLSNDELIIKIQFIIFLIVAGVLLIDSLLSMLTQRAIEDDGYHERSQLSGLTAVYVALLWLIIPSVCILLLIIAFFCFDVRWS